MVNSARPSPSHSSLASRLEFSSGNTRRVSLPVGLAARAALWKDCATQVGEAARVESTPMRTFRVAILLRIVTETEEHTSELQSLAYLVCRLLLEKKKRQHVRRRWSRTAT